MYEIKKPLSSFYFGLSALQRAFIVGNFYLVQKKSSALQSIRFMIVCFIEIILWECNLRSIRFKRYCPSYRAFRFIRCLNTVESHFLIIYNYNFQSNNDWVYLLFVSTRYWVEFLRRSATPTIRSQNVHHLLNCCCCSCNGRLNRNISVTKRTLYWLSYPAIYKKLDEIPNSIRMNLGLK